MIYRQYQLKFVIPAMAADNGASQQLWEIALGMMPEDSLASPLNTLHPLLEEKLSVCIDQEVSNEKSDALEKACLQIKEAVRTVLSREGWLLTFVEAGNTPYCSCLLSTVEEPASTPGKVFRDPMGTNAHAASTAAEFPPEVHQEVHRILERLSKSK